LFPSSLSLSLHLVHSNKPSFHFRRAFPSGRRRVKTEGEPPSRVRRLQTIEPSRSSRCVQ
uniref:Uncharacterized protein n=1 Tax=Cucumis melo TaxID=3656 RepID=A0A9I9E3S9_CUCME